MKVLVTGGAGFIGSHVADLLISQGYAVSVLDNLSTGNLQNLPQGIPVFQTDLTDFASVEHVVAKVAPDFVIHHAAQVDVGTSLVEPIRDAQTNILGSINLFQAAYKAGVKRVVYASSAAAYGDPVTLPLQETSKIEPLSPYGISKYTPEHYLRFFAGQADSSYTILRYANVYGPRQNASGEGGVIAIFSSRLAEGKSVTIYGDGEQTRDFIYVGDVAQANLAALRAGVNGVFNISSGERISLNRLFDLFRQVVGGSVECCYASARPGEILHSSLDPQNAKAYLDWQATTGLKDGLIKTYSWFAQ